MAHAQHVTGAALLGPDRLDRVLDASVAEVPQKGVSRAQRQKRQSRNIASNRLGKEAVDHFVRRSIASNGGEPSDSASISIPSDFGSLSGGSSCCHFHFDTSV